MNDVCAPVSYRAGIVVRNWGFRSFCFGFLGFFQIVLLRFREQLKPDPICPQKGLKLLEISRLRFLSILCCIT